jgi:hypothetical protein
MAAAVEAVGNTRFAVNQRRSALTQVNRLDSQARPIPVFRQPLQEASVSALASCLKGLEEASVPAVCVLDPDGDIVRQLRATARAHRDPAWACCHSELDRFELGGRAYGIVGCAVGAAYAVPVAEQMFAAGCRLLISITSSGQITALRPPPYFILIERALRDEGTSYHYLPPSEYSHADPDLVQRAAGRCSVSPT